MRGLSAERKATLDRCSDGVEVIPFCYVCFVNALMRIDVMLGIGGVYVVPKSIEVTP